MQPVGWGCSILPLPPRGPQIRDSERRGAGRAVKRLDHYWQSRNPIAWTLLPLSWLYCLVAAVRRVAYRGGMLVSHRLPVPVIVVGNISVGGTGKTPLVVWIGRHLRDLGYRPGIVTRGYGGAADQWPQRVGPDGDPALVGDEAVLLARNSGCPVMAGPDRVASGLVLVEELGCDIVVADDGMQHYALQRDLEIAVVDGERRFGNGFCLPAGPLRERPARLAGVDLVVTNGTPPEGGGLWMRMRAAQAVNLRDPSRVRPLEMFRNRQVVAMAGIGNPGRFFTMLQGFGMQIDGRPYPDHHAFRPKDLARFGTTPVLMTEKDAVKCERFAGDNCWYVPVSLDIHPAFTHRLDRLVTGLREDG